MELAWVLDVPLLFSWPEVGIGRGPLGLRGGGGLDGKIDGGGEGNTSSWTTEPCENAEMLLR